MLINLVLGFILPWAFGIYLYIKDRIIFLVIAPFASVLAYTVNEILFYLNFDRFVPINVADDITTISVNLGLYPILGSYLVYYIRSKKVSPYLLIFIFTFLTTAAEYLGLLFGLVAYYNGWNIGWTFLSYLLPYFACYRYYCSLNKIGILRQ